MVETTDEPLALAQVPRGIIEPSQATDEQLWTHLNRFYEQNEKTIDKCIDMDVRTLEKLETVEIYLDSFLETSRVVLDGLVALGNVHPVLGVAILAFHAVISLDIARRDNDRKVRTIMMQMQNMMCTMFQLRRITFAHAQKRETQKEKERLQALVKSIADDITQCGSDLNYYMDQKFISKMIKAKNFERRFQSHVENFIERRAELQGVLTVYVAVAVDFANRNIASMESTLVGVNAKLDAILNALFRRLDTPRERETQSFLDENGGVKVCITQDELLLKLISLAGDVISDGSPPKGDSGKLSRSQSRLLEEVAKDLNLAFEQNFRRFEKLLALQNDNFERLSAQMDRQEHCLRNESEKLDYVLRTSLLILDQGTMIRKAIGYNFALKFSDPDLQQLWGMMGLKRSVKAKRFVLSLRDYLLDTNDDSWALNYIDVAHMQTIVEAIDEDFSGFITVNEANKFALSRPEGWRFVKLLTPAGLFVYHGLKLIDSLLEWIIYWAAAWHINVTEYRRKIYSIILEMHDLLPLVHPANYVIVDDYLDSYAVVYLEALLRSTKEPPSNYRLDSKLSDLAASYAVRHENLLKDNLDTISYSISSDADVTLVAGSARVESWIYPLLYLVLQRHLSIIKLSLVHVLDMDELYRHSNTLTCIFHIFMNRTNDLEAIFNQLHENAEKRLECFAHGMFSTMHRFISGGFNGGNNLLAMRKKGIPSKRMIELLHEASSLEVTPLTLPKPTPPTFHISGIINHPQVAPQTRPPYSLGGYWSGLCWRLSGDKAPFRGIFHCILSTLNDDRIQGTGESYAGSFSVEGSIRMTSRPGIHLVDFKITISDRKDDPVICHGWYDESNDIFDLRWICNPAIQAFPDDSAWIAGTDGNDRGRLNMTRTPVELVRFRPILYGSEGDANVKSLASRRWSYALTAILYQIQAALGSRSFWRARLLERNMWITYTIRYLLERSSSGFNDRKYLHYEHLVKMFELTGDVHPTLGRIYEEMVAFLCDRHYFDKMWVHLPILVVYKTHEASLQAVQCSVATSVATLSASLVISVSYVQTTKDFLNQWTSAPIVPTVSSTPLQARKTAFPTIHRIHFFERNVAYKGTTYRTCFHNAESSLKDSRRLLGLSRKHPVRSLTQGHG
ncbi:hypothetical protein D9619_010120 [Psilocybe cf. subviscida]|uniref:EF-hand domain-containing protein n=1 Tax=Psilocybe cf. subviscida TaxID=2480587 RepID=A0A8H5BLW5_9AGAR|nr:hypothetical protein D9619_010120 [Psilocybe cf. subviscida]